VGRSICREVSLGASIALSRENSLARESSSGPVSRRLFSESTAVELLPQQPPARARAPSAGRVEASSASYAPPASSASYAPPAGVPAQVQSCTASMPTISTLQHGSMQPVAVASHHGSHSPSCSPPLSSRHTVPAHGHAPAQPHSHAAVVHAGPPPRPSPRGASGYSGSSYGGGGSYSRSSYSSQPARAPPAQGSYRGGSGGGYQPSYSAYRR